MQKDVWVIPDEERLCVSHLILLVVVLLNTVVQNEWHWLQFSGEGLIYWRKILKSL